MVDIFVYRTQAVKVKKRWKKESDLGQLFANFTTVYLHFFCFSLIKHERVLVLWRHNYGLNVFITRRSEQSSGQTGLSLGTMSSIYAKHFWVVSKLISRFAQTSKQTKMQLKKKFLFEHLSMPALFFFPSINHRVHIKQKGSVSLVYSQSALGHLNYRCTKTPHFLLRRPFVDWR